MAWSESCGHWKLFTWLRSRMIQCVEDNPASRASQTELVNGITSCLHHRKQHGTTTSGEACSGNSPSACISETRQQGFKAWHFQAQQYKPRMSRYHAKNTQTDKTYYIIISPFRELRRHPNLDVIRSTTMLSHCSQLMPRAVLLHCKPGSFWRSAQLSTQLTRDPATKVPKAECSMPCVLFCRMILLKISSASRSNTGRMNVEGQWPELQESAQTSWFLDIRSRKNGLQKIKCNDRHGICGKTSQYCAQNT